MANFDNYTNYADNAGVSSVIFGAGSTVLEVELNEMQEIQKHYMREFFKSVVGDGITDLSKLTYSDGKVKIADGCNIMCNGYLIKADRLELAITDGTAYLWIWEEEVDYNGTLHVEGNINHANSIENWIKDGRADNETTKRKVVKYQLTNTMPTHPKYSYVAIAKIIGNQVIKLIGEVNPNKADYTDDDIYGIEVDWANNTSIRLANSVGKIGGTDHNNIMAFNRRKCNVASDGSVTAYYGDSAYTETGKLTKAVTVNGKSYAVGNNVQVMVEQNKFYYKVVPLKLEKIEGGIGYKVRKARYYISDTPKDGFKVHPAFVRDDNEVDKIYIGAYKASIYDNSSSTYIKDDSTITIDINADKLASVAGSKPVSGASNGFTRNNARTLASHIGSNWQLKDFTIVSMDMLLFLVEYATLNSQNIIGLGYTHGIGSDTVNSSNITGSTASLGNNTGMADGENGFASITYRGEEDIFGSLWELIDGLNSNSYQCYWANYGFTDDVSDDISPYKSCGFTTAKTSGYITAFGYSIDCDFSFIPAEVLEDNTNANNSIGDYAWISTANTWRTPAYGGSWDGKLNCGICSFNSFTISANSNNNVGSRLAYIPLD